MLVSDKEKKSLWEIGKKLQFCNLKTQKAIGESIGMIYLVWTKRCKVFMDFNNGIVW